MGLLELTPEEIAFLTAPAAPDGLPTRLARKLAATLSARLRLPIQATALPATEPASAPTAPCWQPDAALATLWLTRRLGGRDVAGTGSLIPGSLVRALDAALAECWLDAAAHAAPPRVLAWGITTDSTQATLAVQLPHSSTDMTRWAREIIRHG
ncbi:MAG: hypothetical protein ACM3KD_07885 [Hyphomicrobiaceae bacterium]